MNPYELGSCIVPASWELIFEGLNYKGGPPPERRFDYTLPEYVQLPDGRVLRITQWESGVEPIANESVIVDNPSDEILQLAEQNKLVLISWRK